VELQKKKKILLQGGPSLDCFSTRLRDVPHCVCSEPWNLDGILVRIWQKTPLSHYGAVPQHSWLRKRHAC
jgi:hypothetical protein